MHNIEKRPNIVLKSCGVNSASFLKYVLPFFNIMHEKVSPVFTSNRNQSLNLSYKTANQFLYDKKIFLTWVTT